MPQETMFTVIERRLYFRDSCIFLLHHLNNLLRWGCPSSPFCSWKNKPKGLWGSRDTKGETGCAAEWSGPRAIFLTFADFLLLLGEGLPKTRRKRKKKVVPMDEIILGYTERVGR